MTFCIYTLDGTPNSVIARRAIIQCTNVIVESTIDPIDLARKLFSKEIISENVYRRVKDRTSRDTAVQRLHIILDEIKDLVIYGASIFTKFVASLRELNQQDLANKIMSTYKGIIQIRNACNEN